MDPPFTSDPTNTRSPESQISAELKNIVGDIDDQALFLATVQRAAKTTADHLLVTVRAECRPTDVYSADSRSVKALRQNGVVGQNTNAARTELFDVVASGRLRGLGRDRS